ncbi:MAG: hypothetical protein KDN19_09685 [Verrucomicrobiae bacterium]|nr:hypothetical protein [Verrucomicrobiae bacterium]
MLILAAILPPFLTQAQDSGQKGMIPVLPSALWVVMPEDLKTWELTKSTAESRLAEWLQTRVVRQFEKRGASDKKDSEAPTDSPEPSPRTRIAITDTGKFPGSLAYFDDFQIGTEGKIERRYLADCPAFIYPSGEDEIIAEFKVADRFLVEIAMSHQPAAYLDEWVSRLNLEALSRIPDSERIELPETVGIFEIDQLNPDRNHAYRLATASGDRQDREILEDEDALRQLLGESEELESPVVEESTEGSDKVR